MSIEPTVSDTEPKPVAWQFERSYKEGTWSEPMLSHIKPVEQRPGDLRNVTPLYAHPVPVGEDGARAALNKHLWADIREAGRVIQSISTERGWK